MPIAELHRLLCPDGALVVNGKAVETPAIVRWGDVVEVAFGAKYGPGFTAYNVTHAGADIPTFLLKPDAKDGSFRNRRRGGLSHP